MRLSSKTSIVVCIGLSLLLNGVVFAKHKEERKEKSKRHHSHNMLPRAVSDRDFYANGRPDPAKVELGKLLFSDKILSGNKNVSCASCHHGLTDTGDGLSLPIGEGARGLGVTRDTGSEHDAVHERVPRNAPPVFNLGAREFKTMFHDGRVQVNAAHPSGFTSPAGDDLPHNLDNVLAAQAMFPVTSGTEMAGQAGENSQADAAAAGRLAGVGGVWDIIAKKLQAVPEYVDLFQAAYADITSASDITYVHAANAIAAFEAHAWRADNSPFDRYLRGNKSALSDSAKMGMRLFYGEAKCGQCHSGPFQTDHDFHAIAMPQIGPGKGDGAMGYEDFGRERVTGDAMDRYKFRTPTLRNVALTGPWGHAGAYNSLEAVIEHHLHPRHSLRHYDHRQAVLPYREDLYAKDFMAYEDEAVMHSIARANELKPAMRNKPRWYRKMAVQALLDFLHALTDPASMDLRADVPMRVPSGLPVAD